MKKTFFATTCKRYFITTFWAFFEILFKVRYRFNYIGLENIPQERAVMLLGNHVSWIDWFVLQLPIERRINYMIDKDIYRWRLFNWAFKMAELIPVSKKASKDAFSETSKRLKNGRIVAIFPEGKISKSSEIAKFYRGYEYVDRGNAVIVPFYIDGVFGSLFARHKGNTRRCLLKKREITVRFGEAISQEIKADELRQRVKKLKL
ncbi:1-acyl-sn-glycerol-3-phosphate acyltransferase [Sulfurimonas sp.]|uniref:1-acyl-sn-glycerol-3-phosphate acyltransferase n=1 Tax=Sulfurimonas sp. TaxID=2022749 RepID=UPI0025F0F87B|nr:1-acyl-sn-glycerol-3-phosphate acyltransferase [Sulfurimonas sp.]MCK9473489.1 1-acyl-sn-glycerol-3-phosphate acyltransferase [Sulfurimonas sp.]